MSAVDSAAEAKAFDLLADLCGQQEVERYKRFGFILVLGSAGNVWAITHPRAGAALHRFVLSAPPINIETLLCTTMCAYPERGSEEECMELAAHAQPPDGFAVYGTIVGCECTPCQIVRGNLVRGVPSKYWRRSFYPAGDLLASQALAIMADEDYVFAIGLGKTPQLLMARGRPTHEEVFSAVADFLVQNGLDKAGAMAKHGYSREGIVVP